jgi:hypothetical protein
MQLHPLFKPTVALLAATTLVGIAYDVWAVSHNYNWTISANLWNIARHTNYGPAIVAVGFFLLGHVLMPNRSAETSHQAFLAAFAKVWAVRRVQDTFPADVADAVADELNLPNAED